MPQLPPDYFTPQSVLTLTGATGAVYAVSSGLQHAFNWNPRWLGLALSVVLALVGAHTTQPHLVATYLVGIVNGFLVYCTAVGVNSITAKLGDAGAVAKGSLLHAASGPASRRSFRSRWF